jgi:predicted Zn finger-like uncharacterized protein
MSMITVCPACGTSFRVTPQQLQAHHGTVRCGRCAHIFDGFQSLSTQPDAPPTEAPLATPPPVVISPAVIVEPLESAPQFVMPVEEAVAIPKQRGLVFGIVLMLLVLTAQAAYFWRDEIVAYEPALQPQLERLCAQLRCTVSLPQQPWQITIEGSEMQAIDPTAPGRIVLTATLRSHATIPLGYPALDVVLTDNDDHTVARRIFLPAEYLDSSKDARTGIAPNTEITVRLNLDVGDLGATGFRLDPLSASQS